VADAKAEEPVGSCAGDAAGSVSVLTEEVRTYMRRTVRVIVIVATVCACVGGVVILRSIHEARQYRDLTQCAYNLHEIGVACLKYAGRNGGVLPESFAQITNDIESPAIFISPLSGNRAGTLGDVDAWADYVLVRGISVGDTNKVLAYYFCASGAERKGTILLANGAVLRACGNAEYARYFGIPASTQ
jgi:hypothetical protein